MYRTQRNYENLNKAIFEGVGEYGIPQIKPVHTCDVQNWISFNYAKGCEEPEEHGVHFFIDDYQFIRVWNDPDRYMKMLRKFSAVLTPDFFPHTRTSRKRSSCITIIASTGWAHTGRQTGCMLSRRSAGAMRRVITGVSTGNRSAASLQ